MAGGARADGRNDYNLVLLCVRENVARTVANLGVYREFIAPKKVVVVGSAELRAAVPEDGDTAFLDEDALLPGLTLGAVREEIARADMGAAGRAGWYFQQFLKLAYALVCADGQYLAWDSDTVPLHAVRMKSGGSFVFDVKTEHNRAYFDTLGRILPGLKKEHDFSFVSEHMLFDTGIVTEMVRRIEGGSGVPFWRVVLRSIGKKDLAGSGFSEFETYGTYTMRFHPGAYTTRRWRSFREEAVFFPRGISAADFNRLGMGYDAKSFESHRSHRRLARVLGRRPFQSRWFIALFVRAKELAKAALSLGG